MRSCFSCAAFCFVTALRDVAVQRVQTCGTYALMNDCMRWQSGLAVSWLVPFLEQAAEDVLCRVRVDLLCEQACACCWG